MPPKPRARASNQRKRGTVDRFPYPHGLAACNSTSPANSAYCNSPTSKTGRKSAPPRPESPSDWQGSVRPAAPRYQAPDIVLHKRRSINYNIFCCEMKKASKPGQGDARKVKRLVRHINYHFGIDLYKINRTEARFTLYYLRTGYKQCQKEEYFFNRKTNQIEPLKV